MQPENLVPYVKVKGLKHISRYRDTDVFIAGLGKLYVLQCNLGFYKNICSIALPASLTEPKIQTSDFDHDGYHHSPSDSKCLYMHIPMPTYLVCVGTSNSWLTRKVCSNQRILPCQRRAQHSHGLHDIYPTNADVMAVTITEETEDRAHNYSWFRRIVSISVDASGRYYNLANLLWYDSACLSSIIRITYVAPMLVDDDQSCKIEPPQ